jgi:hypothetical protein
VQCNPESGLSRSNFVPASRTAADSSYNTPEVLQGIDAASGILKRPMRLICLSMASFVLPIGAIAVAPVVATRDVP